MPHIGRFLRTAAHLTPSQVWHRGRKRVRAAVWERLGLRVDARYRVRAAQLPACRLDHPGLARAAEIRCAQKSQEASLATARDALEGRFTFHGVTREFGLEVDWYRADLEEGTRLWKTLLHEFSYAIDLARATRSTGDAAFLQCLVALTESWEKVSPIGRPGYAAEVWNARAVATRLINWALAASILETPRGDPFTQWVERQLPVHALFLRDNLELDLRGNHLLRDCVGLVFAGELLGNPSDALGRLRAELDEQVLADGCHIERSPLYHAISLQDLLECRALLGARTPGWIDETANRMAGFLHYLIAPDGKLPLLGDTWHGAVDPGSLLAAAGETRTMPKTGVPEQSSGLVTLRRGALQAVVRAGPHGPDYQMGHTHADGLSFELYADTTRVITDTGTGSYGAGPERTRLRSTAAHNTVQLDGEEQLEAWGSFRAGRRGRGRVVSRGSDETWDWVCGTHDGYRWLRGKPLHQRLLAVSRDGVVVLDVVDGRGTHRIRNALHLHPDSPTSGVRIEALGGRVQTTRVPLFERWNENREMAEWFVEAEAKLPWVGGWVLLFGDSAAPLQTELHRNGRTVVLRCGEAVTPIEVHWNFDGGDAEFGPRVASSCCTSPSSGLSRGAVPIR